MKNDARLVSALLALQLLAVTAAAEGPVPPETYAAPGSRLFDGGGLGLKPPQARAGLVDPSTGIEMEAGRLGGEMIGSGAYFSLGKSASGSGRGIDWGLQGRASVLDMTGRFFTAVPAPVPLIKDAVDPMKTTQEQLYIFSVLGNVGRAYQLFGPVDVGWSVMGLGRVDHIFPNATLDQTVSTRLRLGGGHSVGAFGGITETVGVLSDRWARAVVAGDSIYEPRVVTAPHAEVGVWGPLAGDDTGYKIFAAMQKNPMTDVVRLDGSVFTQTSRGVLSIGARAERETGFGGDFERNQRAGRIMLDQDNGLKWSVEAGKRDIAYGGAQMNDAYVMFGLTIVNKPTGRAVGQQLGATSGGEITAPTPAWAGNLQQSLSDAVVRLDLLLKGASSALASASPERVTADLQSVYATLPSDLKASLKAELGGAPDFKQISAALSANLPGAVKVSTVEIERARGQLALIESALSNPNRLENILTRYMRVSIYQALEGTTVKLWGRETPLTPGLLVAAAHAYGQGLTTIAPVPAGMLGPALDAELAKRLKERFNLNCAGNELVSCAMAGLPPEVRARLQGVPADKARQIIAEALGLVGEAIRIEVNRLLLSLYVSAKQLDVLSVERGESLGTLGRDAILSSYARLEARNPARASLSAPYQKALELGARRAAAEAAYP